MYSACCLVCRSVLTERGREAPGSSLGGGGAEKKDHSDCPLFDGLPPGPSSREPIIFPPAMCE